MDAARIYTDAQKRLLDLAAELTPGQLDTRVPALPAWNVRKTYAHLAGVCADVGSGRAVPPADDATTARQVEERRTMSLEEVCEQWRADTPALMAAFEQNTAKRYVLPAVDIWHHENDIYGALGRPGNREHADALADFALRGFARGWTEDRPGLRVVATDSGQEWDLGSGADLVLRARVYELARLVLGRRSRAQALAMDWSGGDPEPVIGFLHAFPMPAGDLSE